jgi:hypothetical protein
MPWVATHSHAPTGFAEAEFKRSAVHVPGHPYWQFHFPPTELRVPTPPVAAVFGETILPTSPQQLRGAGRKGVGTSGVWVIAEHSGQRVVYTGVLRPRPFFRAAAMGFQPLTAHWRASCNASAENRAEPDHLTKPGASGWRPSTNTAICARSNDAAQPQVLCPPLLKKPCAELLSFWPRV